MPLASVERAEVVRGPFSSLYGANAFAGAINAITRPGEGPPAADFFASGGAAGYYQLGTSVRGESGPVRYSFTADRRKIDNVYNRDTRTVPRIAEDGSLQQQDVPLRNVGYEDVRMTGRLDLSVSDAWAVTLLPRISRYETGLDMSSRLPAEAEEHKRDTAVNLGGILRYNGAGPLAAQIRTSYRYSNQRLFQENFTLAPTRQTTIVDPPGPAVSESVSHGVFPFAALTGQDTDFRSVLVEPQLTWAPNLAHTVVLGASYTGERGAFGDSTIADRSNLLGSDATLARVAAGIQAGMAAGGVPNPTVTLVRDPAIGEVFPLSQGRRERFDIFSAYVQDEWAPADRLRLVPGLRYDRFEYVRACADRCRSRRVRSQFSRHPALDGCRYLPPQLLARPLLCARVTRPARFHVRDDRRLRAAGDGCGLAVRGHLVAAGGAGCQPGPDLGRFRGVCLCQPTRCGSSSRSREVLCEDLPDAGRFAATGTHSECRELSRLPAQCGRRPAPRRVTLHLQRYGRECTEGTRSCLRNRRID